MIVQVSMLTLVRWKKLKVGGRAIRGYYSIPCRALVTPGDDGTFTTFVDNRYLRAKLCGKMTKNGNFSMHAEQCDIFELKHPYLKKGFKQILGYILKTNRTNLNQKGKGHKCHLLAM